MKVQDVFIPTNRRPTPPGWLIREFLEDEALNLTQGELATALGIGRQNLNTILNGKRAVTPLMAMRLERVLGPSKEMWLNLQLAVDLYDAIHSPEGKKIAKLKRITRAA
jgi:antitoxin HigA-1